MIQNMLTYVKYYCIFLQDITLSQLCHAPTGETHGITTAIKKRILHACYPPKNGTFGIVGALGGTVLT